MIGNFNELLQATREQSEPQRLLFLFAKTEAKKAKKKKKADQTGTISPLMCVDKLADELDTFQNLVNEADQIAKDWDFVIIAGLSGANGLPPTTEQAEPHLNQMANNLVTGQDLSQYVIFDREENPIVVQARQ